MHLGTFNEAKQETQSAPSRAYVSLCTCAREGVCKRQRADGCWCSGRRCSRGRQSDSRKSQPCTPCLAAHATLGTLHPLGLWRAMVLNELERELQRQGIERLPLLSSSTKWRFPHFPLPHPGQCQKRSLTLTHPQLLLAVFACSEFTVAYSAGF